MLLVPVALALRLVPILQLGDSIHNVYSERLGEPPRTISSDRVRGRLHRMLDALRRQPNVPTDQHAIDWHRNYQ